MPALALSDHGTVPDGAYRYKMTAILGEADEQSDVATGAEQDEIRRPGRTAVSKSGAFMVLNGTIQPLSETNKKQ